MSETENEEQCMDIAPSHIAVTVVCCDDGILRTPYCRLPCGHSGSHKCGELEWTNDE